MTTLMLYLSHFSSDRDIQLIPSTYASEQVALLGAECSDEAWQVLLDTELKSGQTLSFDIGVPFELNHLNPLTAEKPLNVSEMFWSWQLGHKFLRFDSAQEFSFHLGSTGCKSPSRLRPAQQECSYPNRYRFIIDNFKPEKPIVFDLDRLLAQVNKTQSCMSEQDSQVCKQLFSNLQQPLFYQE